MNENIEKPLELRMYFLVIYQLTGIQMGIQCGHAALEYARRFGDTIEFKNFVDNWKTWIILNGGTTNDERDFKGIAQGTLNQYGDLLNDNDIPFSFFHEPDLNNSLTSLCFIADERVFNRKDYPDFRDYLSTWFLETNIKIKNTLNDTNDNINNSIIADIIDTEKIKEFNNLSNAIANATDEELIKYYPDGYKAWIRFIGGIKNEFLRSLIKDKKLA